MPDPIETVVQRMIDAGESEQDIASVIQHAKSASADSGISPWLMGAGVAGTAALGAAIHNPALAKTAAKGAMDLRRMSMLSGLAPLKSLLGNVGGAAYSSIERGSMAPIREMLSSKTAREAVDVFKANPNYETAGPAAGLSKYNIPGRIMGALDTAAQSALKRAGLSSEGAAIEMLQRPLGQSPLINSLTDNPVADVLVPFRRTPINQFGEGIASFKPENLATTGQKVAQGVALGTGALMGAEAEDPKTIALGTAFSGKRGLPFAAAAGVSRALTSGSKRSGAEAMQGLSPISDYSLEQGVLGPVMSPTEPASWGLEPAAFKAMDYIRKMLGMQ